MQTFNLFRSKDIMILESNEVFPPLRGLNGGLSMWLAWQVWTTWKFHTYLLYEKICERNKFSWTIGTCQSVHTNGSWKRTNGLHIKHRSRLPIKYYRLLILFRIIPFCPLELENTSKILHSSLNPLCVALIIPLGVADIFLHTGV